MSKKYMVTGTNGEELGILFRENSNSLMIGGRTKYKDFLDHFCFNVLGLSKDDVVKEGKRQSHKFRYYFDVEINFTEPSYAEKEQNGFKELDPIGKLFGDKWFEAATKYEIIEIDTIVKLT